MVRDLLMCVASTFLAMTSPAMAQSVSDPLSVPVTTQDIGAFPFVDVRQGYVTSDEKTLGFEQKYFFTGNRVRTVEGPYYHANVWVKGGEWNQTLLLRDFDQQIARLGGKRVFDGRMPDPARAMIKENEPSFVKDLYDPWPYRFRQYVIHTADSLIWIELGYGYNTNMADLSVMVEKIS